MSDHEGAKRLLQKAYNLDEDIEKDGDIDLSEFDWMGVHLHYYDQRLCEYDEIADLLQRKPNGKFATVIKKLIEVRVQNNEYTLDTLQKMYNVKL